MYILFILALILGGIVAASSAIIAKKPDAKEALAKLAPFHGIIGLVMLILGIIKLLESARYLGTMLTSLWGFVGLAAMVLSIPLGFLFGFGTIKAFANKNKEEAPADDATSAEPSAADNFQRKIASIQTPLGVAAIIIGLVLLGRHLFG